MSTSKSREVECAYCSWRGRRDKLASHTSSKHEAERPREKNQKSLSIFFATKNTDPNSNRPLNEGENQPDEPRNKLRKVELEHRPIVGIRIRLKLRCINLIYPLNNYACYKFGL